MSYGQADEKTRLRKEYEEDVLDHIVNAYGCNDHAKFVKSFDGKSEVVTDYDPMKFASLRVFMLSKGTVLRDPILWIEQLIVTLIFIGFAAPVYIYFGSDDFVGNRKGDVSVRKWLANQEPKMRQFAMIMTTLSSFLLGFYTSMAVARWWVIRTKGVGGIKAATVELEMFISQMVTQEERILDCIRRYGRTSLMLVFLWRRGQLGQQDDLRTNLVERGFLTDEEATKLMSWNHCLHETIWAWQTGIVTMLQAEGKIPTDQVLNLLMERCREGREAVQCIHTHVAVRIPMQFVHLLGFLVKLHNFVLAMIMGILFGAAVRNAETIICVQLFARTLLLPFLFNAILLINAELSDPFNGSSSDFPASAYEKALDKDCRGFISAAQNMPDWITRRTKSTA